MSSRHQRVLLRRRMHQRLDIIAYWREQAHVPDARPLCETRSPFFCGGSCQRPLKRKLRHEAWRDRYDAMRRRQIPIMVNHRLPRTVAKCLRRMGQAISARRCVTSTPSKLRQGAASGAFAKILAKLYFFQLFENLRRILLNYGQKRTRRANATFNAAC